MVNNHDHSGGLLPSVRHIAKQLLAKPLYRERFLHFNVDDRTSREKLKSWSLNLRGLRWQAVMEFTLALKDVEHILR